MNETLEQRVAERTAELTRSNRELEQFAYIASHDLQEPLRAVEGFIGRLRDRCEDKLDDRAKQYMHFAVEGAQRMSQLVYSLLEYSRVQSYGLQAAPTPMKDVFEQAVADCAAGIAESGAAVTCDDLPTIMGDAMQLGQLLQNLIGNAIKFRREGVRPEIHVSAKKGSGAGGQEEKRQLSSPEPRTLNPDPWVFSVQDNGIGIPRTRSSGFS